ncbi:MAG TPA: hypothetical protein VFU36_12850 [Jatrophihabitans sp.]|nr:hypothetical protein [Jatrophihabitans sp.]
MALLQPPLVRAGSVGIQMSQNPLTEQPNRVRVVGAGLLQQGGFYRGGVPGPLRLRDRLNRLGDHRGMLQAHLTGGNSRGGMGKDRLQGLPGQAAPGTEALHRPHPPPRHGQITPQLHRDQISQAAIAQRAGHITSVQLGQRRQLPEPLPRDVGLRLRHHRKLLRIGRTLLAHAFDSTIERR